MKVERIRLKQITRHHATDVELPERAVVLVTGNNGRGKSTFLEAVAFAGWKRGLRAPRWNPWVVATPGATEPGSIELVAASVEIARKVSKGGTVTTTWNLPGAEPTKYETATKAQEALEQVIGDFDVWSRACTFSKAHATKAARFGAATDGERKTLLESILGLDYFDAALKRCREDLKKLRTERAGVEHAVQMNQVRLENQQQRLRDVERDLAAHTIPAAVPRPTPAALPEVPPESVGRAHRPPPTAAELDLAAKIDTLNERIVAEEAHARALQVTYDALLTAGVKEDAAAEEIGHRHDRLMQGACGECEQLVPFDTLARLTERAVEARARARVERANAAAQRDDLNTQREEAAWNLSTFRTQLTALTSEKAALSERLVAERKAAKDAQAVERNAVLERRRLIEDANAAALKAWETADSARTAAARTRADLETRKASIEKDAATLTACLKEDTADVAARTRVIQTKEAAEFALSPKGFRAHLLGKTLDGLSACTNGWLAALGYGSLRVELRPYSEKADGDLADAIDLKVSGVGHAFGYAGCSDGEQRRMDIAFLLALMEVSTGALGASDSTLWLDEVFDALDADGVRAVCSLLDRLAKERTVVVIAHSPALIEALRPTMILHVEPDTSNPEVSRVVVRTRPRSVA